MKKNNKILALKSPSLDRNFLPNILGLRLPRDNFKTGIFFDIGPDISYIHVTGKANNVTELTVGAALAEIILIVLDRRYDDVIELLKGCQGQLSGKTIVLCVTKRDEENSVNKRVSDALPNSFVSESILLPDDTEILKSILNNPDYRNQPSRDGKMIILNPVVHRGFGRGYEAIPWGDNSGNETELSELNQKSIMSGYLHGNLSYFVPESESIDHDVLPLIITDKDEYLGIIERDEIDHDQPREPHINFRLVAPDWLGILNLQNEVTALAKIQELEHHVRFVDRSIGEDSLVGYRRELHNLSLSNAQEQDNWKKITAYCGRVFFEQWISQIAIEWKCLLRVRKVFEKVQIGKGRHRILGCRLTKGSFTEGDCVFVSDSYRRIEQVWSGQERIKSANEIGKDYGLLLSEEDFQVKERQELTVYDKEHEKVLRKTV